VVSQPRRTLSLASSNQGHSNPPLLRECDVDQPRNLANFVTVEPPPPSLWNVWNRPTILITSPDFVNFQRFR
jgi:hypothetical protein